MSTLVKICGVTNLDDAETCVREGADAIGLNFVPSSKRCISVLDAKVITSALRGRIPFIGVVADMSEDEMRRLLYEADLTALQLHGDESPELVARMQPLAYKAVRIASAEDIARADSFPGDDLLLDAKSSKGLGGTGEPFDWSLAKDIAEKRRITLAGGLTPENVVEAIRAISPYRVDVASGVEIASNPRKKDLSRVRAFVATVKGAHSSKQ